MQVSLSRSDFAVSRLALTLVVAGVAFAFFLMFYYTPLQLDDFIFPWYC